MSDLLVNNEEIWKDIVGFEGIYQISNRQNVKCLSHLDAKGSRIKESILSQKKKGKTQDLFVRLKNNDYRVRLLYHVTFVESVDIRLYKETKIYVQQHKKEQNKIRKNRYLELNKEFYQDIKDNYHKRDAQYFAKKYSKAVTTVQGVACRLKVTAKYHFQSILKEVVDKYVNEKVGLKELQETYGHYAGTYKKEFQKLGIIIRDNSEANKVYEWDESYFEKIDSHQKAYWLGFIYADGNVRVKQEGGHVFQISLKDREPIIKLKEHLKSTHKLFEDNGSLRFTICQKKIYDDLNRLGVHPNKSLTCKFPNKNKLPPEFRSSFILGYFDGDGSISLSKYNVILNVVGTLHFIKKISKYLMDDNNIGKFGVRQEKRSGAGKIYYFNTWASRNSENGKIKLGKIYNYLYKNIDFALKRKQDKFKEVLGL